jgi:glycosyltransferase involved in cell wall biosynthesis
MKIMLCSHTFSPNIGGTETVARLLASEFIAAGHQVKICSRTPGAPADDLGFEVVRNPSGARFRADVRWADVVLQSNVSLPWALPLILMRKPWVCANHNWPRDDNGKLGFRGWLKLRASRLASAQTACSKVLASQLLGAPVIVGNPYDAAFFRTLPSIARDRDIVYLGRLFEGKGVDTLLRAVALVHPQRPGVNLTIIGRGPAEEELRDLCAKLGLSDYVVFKGSLFGDELITEMNRHTLCVVPSRARESFGIVALEAMACGCVVIGSDHGGVPEAVGEGGPIFPTDDADRLAAIAIELLTSESALDKQHARQADHLAAFSSANVARRYLDVLERAAKHEGADYHLRQTQGR